MQFLRPYPFLWNQDRTGELKIMYGCHLPTLNLVSRHHSVLRPKLLFSLYTSCKWQPPQSLNFHRDSTVTIYRWHRVLWARNDGLFIGILNLPRQQVWICVFHFHPRLIGCHLWSSMCSPTSFSSLASPETVWTCQLHIYEFDGTRPSNWLKNVGLVFDFQWEEWRENYQQNRR